MLQLIPGNITRVHSALICVCRPVNTVVHVSDSPFLNRLHPNRWETLFTPASREQSPRMFWALYAPADTVSSCSRRLDHHRDITHLIFTLAMSHLLVRLVMSSRRLRPLLLIGFLLPQLDFVPRAPAVLAGFLVGEPPALEGFRAGD